MNVLGFCLSELLQLKPTQFFIRSPLPLTLMIILEGVCKHSYALQSTIPRFSSCTCCLQFILDKSITQILVTVHQLLLSTFRILQTKDR